ncbi:MAG: hypothetical protein GF408_02770 [Candidatus Omnitrophica bacterium]|nr:hypothetical protein [Candidatus Omnitrophota bacterium]
MKVHSLSGIFNNESVKARYFTTLAAGLFRTGLGFVTGLVIARALGPSGFGNVSFLLGTFTSIDALIGMGSAAAFYTFVSQRRRDRGFYVYYFGWLAARFVLVSALILFLLPGSVRDSIWLGLDRDLIFLAFLASFAINQIWETVHRIGESVRASILVQAWNTLLIITHFLVIIGAFLLKSLTPRVFLLVMAFEYSVMAVLLSNNLKQRLFPAGERTDGSSLKETFFEYKAYCTPLAVYNLAAFASLFANRWLLQRFGGAVEQSYFSIALKFSSVCLIATTSVIKIFWKEIADAHQKNDSRRKELLFKEITRNLYIVGAFGCCFFVPFSRQMLVSLLGQGYEAGWPALSIMFLLPLSQSLAQLSTAFFHATSQTGTYKNVRIAKMVISLPVTYFLVASPSASVPGLGWGAFGLSLKDVFVSLLWVNVIIYIITRTSKWKFDFWYQLYIPLIFLTLSFSIRLLVTEVFGWFGVRDTLTVILPSGLIYLSLSVILFLKMPSLAGLDRQEVRAFLDRITRPGKGGPGSGAAGDGEKEVLPEEVGV